MVIKLSDLCAVNQYLTPCSNLDLPLDFIHPFLICTMAEDSLLLWAKTPVEQQVWADQLRKHICASASEAKFMGKLTQKIVQTLTLKEHLEEPLCFLEVLKKDFNEPITSDCT